MKKQGILNLTDYYFYRQKNEMLRYSGFFVLLPLFISSLYGVLKFSSIALLVMSSLKPDVTFTDVFKDILIINVKFNILSFFTYIIKNIFFAFYILVIHAIIKERMILNLRNCYRILSDYLLELILVGSVVGLGEWLILKLPLIGYPLSLIYNYLSYFAILLSITRTLTNPFLCLKQSWKVTLRKILGLLALDFYYLCIPSLFGISLIVLTNSLGIFTAQLLISLFGIMIATLVIWKKLPKAMIARIIYFLTTIEKET